MTSSTNLYYEIFHIPYNSRNLTYCQGISETKPYYDHPYLNNLKGWSFRVDIKQIPPGHRLIIKRTGSSGLSGPCTYAEIVPI